MAEKACGQVLSLPIFPRTSFEELEYIEEALVAAIHNLKR